MLEYANLLLKIADYQKAEFKYIPVNSETENMTIGEVIDSLKIEKPLTEIVYNDNNKSHILDFINFVPINGTNDNQKVWRVAIDKLMAAILDQRAKVGMTRGELEKNSVKYANNAKLTLYNVFGEEITNTICEKLNKINIEPPRNPLEVIDGIDSIIDELEIKENNGHLTYKGRR